MSDQGKPKGKLLITIFKDVKNMESVKEMVATNEVEVSLLKPALIMDYFQIHIATLKSTRNFCNGNMKTRKLVSEIVFNLSPSKHIGKSFDIFTPENNDSEALVLAHSDLGCESQVQEFLSSIKGKKVSVNLIPMFTNIEKIKELYGIKSNDISRDGILDIVVAKMAVKEFY